jgi:hypothetical protein
MSQTTEQNAASTTTSEIQTVQQAVSIVNAAAPHQAALNNVQSAVATAAPIVAGNDAGLSPTAAAKVTAGMGLIARILEDIRAEYETLIGKF